MFIVYDNRDKNIWGAGTTKDEAWNDARVEVSSYISWLRHHGQRVDISMDDLILYFRCSKCHLQVWQRHILSEFPKAEKAVIIDGVAVSDT